MRELVDSLGHFVENGNTSSLQLYINITVLANFINPFADAHVNELNHFLQSPYKIMPDSSLNICRIFLQQILFIKS